MAQINVQPKKRNNWWVWALLVLVIAAALIYLSKNRVLPAGDNGVNSAAPMDSTNVTDTSALTGEDSALHFHNGITGQ